jgi:hypothetical protein
MGFGLILRTGRRNSSLFNGRSHSYLRGDNQMGLHPHFPTSPYVPLTPEQRWFPADETLRATAYEKLLPPLVAKIRKEVHAWRNQGYLEATKSVFPKTVGEPHSGGFELSFAAFLEEAKDVAAFAKNYLAVGFRLDYVKADGDLSNYTPDFIVRAADSVIWIVETKGRAELDLPQKMARLKQWCADATAAEENGQRYDFVFVDQNGFGKHAPKTFAALAASFTEYKSWPCT